MKWSPQQDAALVKAAAWFKNPGDQQVFRLFGYAGTGKTTIAKELAAGCGEVLYAAYTGKAASVMQSRGCAGAGTIHQLIYNPADRSRKKLQELEEELAEIPPPEREGARRLRQAIEEEKSRVQQPGFLLNKDSDLKSADLLIVDEASMVGERLAMDLLSFGTPVLVLGDPAQLPPVKDTGYFIDAEPDVMLTEIHRQAADSPVIQIATMIRQGTRPSPGVYGDSLILRGRPEEEQVTGCDQIIVGRNVTRQRCNVRSRTLLGMGDSPMPVEGDRLVCLRNDHQEGLLNGTLWSVQETWDVPESEDRIGIRLADDLWSVSVEAHTHYFRGEKPEFWAVREAQCFDFGYALTAHKAQGSQWPSVFIFDESRAFRQDAQKWLYTAVTRAEQRVVVSV